jgi:hypothetical protein
MNGSDQLGVSGVTPPSPASGPRLAVRGRSISSWYTQGHSDGVGDRLLMFDNSNTPSLEVLRFTPELAGAFGFEPALRDRVEQLKSFTHAAFPEIHAVEYLEGTPDLTLVSTYTAGKRLTDVLRSLQPGMHASFATWLIRELTVALDELQRHCDGIGHGVLTPDRIVLTPDSHLVIVEHALGPAIERLHWSPWRLWQNFGIVSADNEGGSVPVMHARTDVVQLALIAMSIVIGRNVCSHDYQERLDALFEEFATQSGRGSSTSALQEWLERALRNTGEPFRSAKDARAALGSLGAPRPGAALEFFQPRTLAAAPSESANDGTTEQPAPAAHPAARLLSAVSAPQADARAGKRPDSPTLDAFTPEFAPVRRLMSADPVLKVDPQTARDRMTRQVSPSRQSPTASTPAQPDRQPERPESPAPEGGRTSIWSTPSKPEPESWRQTAEEPVLTPPPHKKPRRVLTAMLWTIVALEAVVIASLLYSTPSPLPAIFPVTLESLNAGDTVLVNGKPVGVTPLRLNVEPNVQSIEIQSVAPPPAGPSGRDEENREPKAKSREPAIDQAAARQRSGGFRITSPIEIQVLQGDRVLGSSSDGSIVARAGVHDFDFVNTAFGYRSRHRVEIRANQIVNVTVTPPPGRVSINVTPWAQVWIDGDAVGDTPIANREMSVGEHQVTVRHPKLGAHTEKFVIRPGQLTRVTPTLGQ